MNDSPNMPDIAGKYLTFRMASEEYGLSIHKVREIIGLMNITRVPRTPPYIRGVINLRGKVIPVLDLKDKLGMGRTDDNIETCINVVEVNLNGEPILMGIIVDAVNEVIDISTNEIAEAPAISACEYNKFILGIGKVNNKIIILLDIDKVIAEGDLSIFCREKGDNIVQHDPEKEPMKTGAGQAV
jgi:purine-binding chemotaxis protein CheW